MLASLSNSWLDQGGVSLPSPSVIWISAAAGILAGLVLLLAGGKVLRPVAIFLGGAAGVLAGWSLVPSLLSEAIYGVPPNVVGATVGGIIGMVAAAVLFRAAMAAAGAVTFGAAGFLLAGIAVQGLPQEAALVQGPDPARIMLIAAQDFPSAVDEKVAQAAAGSAVDGAWQACTRAWDSVPPQNRMTIVASGLGAALLGLLIGAVMPRRAAALLTALSGAGILLASVTLLARGAELPGRAFLEHGPMGWLAIWLVVAAAGLIFQLCGQVQPRPKTQQA